MSIFEIVVCDLCGKEIPEKDPQRTKTYELPYFYDDDLGPTIEPECKMNLCKECATKVRDFCKTIDHVNGYVK